MSHDTLELLEVTSEDVGVYQCLVDNGGQPVIENHTVILAGNNFKKHAPHAKINFFRGTKNQLVQHQCNCGSWRNCHVTLPRVWQAMATCTVGKI